jgi:hypothetical protein
MEEYQTKGIIVRKCLRPTRSDVVGVVLAVLMGSSSSCGTARPSGSAPGSYRGTAIDMESKMGSETSYFVRENAPGQKDGPVMASQLRITSGTKPGLTISWPAGNSGIFVGFKSPDGALDFERIGDVIPVADKNGQRGIFAALRASVSGTKSRATDVELDPIIEGSMRYIRDVRDYHTPQPRVAVSAHLQGGRLVAERESIDHLTHDSLTLRPAPGTSVSLDSAGHWHLGSKAGKPIEFEIRATTDEQPLTPVPIEEIVTPAVLKDADVHSLEEFNYLVYDESMLAGADNYLTMFGRDNEFLVTIGADGLQPKAFEIVLASHLEAMRDDGNLAHEPAVGEFASFLNEEAGLAATRAPHHDYKMMDTRFLMAPSVARYLEKTDPEQVSRFFARKTSKGLTYRQALEKNLKLVLDTARPFAGHPTQKNLVAIDPAFHVGQWRDSNEGLGGGIYAFDINAALVPAALSAIVEIGQKFHDPQDAELSALVEEAQRDYAVWSKKAWGFFQVSVPKADARKKATAYAKQLKMGPEFLPPRLPGGTVKFSAVSLDAQGKPVPIMNTDGGFVLLYSKDSPDDRVLEIVRNATLPFPFGLASPIGVFVSNAAYAPPKLRKTWNFDGYHQLVVWPWQEFLIVKGIANQLERRDLKAATVQELESAELKLWKILYDTAPYLSIELYSGAPHKGALVPVAYGESSGQTATIIQAWSKLALFVRPPSRVVSKLGKMPNPSAEERHFFRP